MQLPENKEEKNMLLKTIFDYCVEVNWQKTSLDKKARELGTTRTKLRKLAKSYAKKNLNYEEYQKLCQELEEILDFEKKDTRSKLNVINPILLEKINKSTYLLWENKEEREIVLEYIYNYCTKENWDKNKLNELAKKLGITIDRLKVHAKKYAKEHLSFEDYQLVEQQIKESAITSRELKKIKLTIINPIILQELNKTTYLLWENEKEKELVLKYIYEYCVKSRFNGSNIESLAQWLGITKENINEYCKEYALEYLKWTKEQYFRKRCEYLKNSLEFPNILEEIKQIIAYIKFGIIENRINRPFDIIDYYLTIKIPLNKILELTKNRITNEEYLLLRAFVYDNKDTFETIPYTEIISSNDEERDIIISFLSNNNIPINNKTYTIAYKRYINSTLDLNLETKHRK